MLGGPGRRTRQSQCRSGIWLGAAQSLIGSQGPSFDRALRTSSPSLQATESAPFLTDIDSRAAIKGSRDPLGLVPVWSRFGRHVVGNLSTVSNSTRGFTTLLLGYYFAEVIRERDGSASPSTLDLFLKFEQLAGYARLHVNSDRGFRGIDL